MRPDRFGQGDIGREFLESPGRERDHAFPGNTIRGLDLVAGWVGFPSLLTNVNDGTAKPFRLYPNMRIIESYAFSGFSRRRDISYTGRIYGTVDSSMPPIVETVVNEDGGNLNVNGVQLQLASNTETERIYNAFSGTTPFGSATITLSGDKSGFNDIFPAAWNAFKALTNFNNVLQRYSFVRTADGPTAVLGSVQSSGISLEGPSTSGLDISTAGSTSATILFPDPLLLRARDFSLAGSMSFRKRAILATSSFKIWDVRRITSIHEEMACGSQSGTDFVDPVEIDEDYLVPIPYSVLQPYVYRFAFPPDTSVGAYVGPARPSCAPEIVS